MMLHSRLTRAEYRHCMVLGGQLPWQVYPLRPGDYQGNPNAFSGSCADIRLYDSVVAGAVGKSGFTVAENSTLSYNPTATQQPSTSGRWNVDTAVANWSTADIMSRQEVPNYELSTLAALWSW